MGREQKEEKSMNISKRRFLFQNGGYYHIFYRDVRVSAYEHPHMHSFWQCLFVKKGRITQIQDGTKYYQVEGGGFSDAAGARAQLVCICERYGLLLCIFFRSFAGGCPESLPTNKKRFF